MALAVSVCVREKESAASCMAYKMPSSYLLLYLYSLKRETDGCRSVVDSFYFFFTLLLTLRAHNIPKTELFLGHNFVFINKHLLPAPRSTMAIYFLRSFFSHSHAVSIFTANHTAAAAAH